MSIKIKFMKHIAILFFAAFAGFSMFAQTFTLTSSTLEGQATQNEEYDGFGCSGKNMSPQLSWKNAPEGTKSFAIMMYDPDAPTGSGFWHWVMFDIPADVNELREGAGSGFIKYVPTGAIQSNTDYGKPGYGGPCPPKGDGKHAYIITVYALPVSSLGLNSEINPAIVGFNVNAKALAKASIIAYYER